MRWTLITLNLMVATAAVLLASDVQNSARAEDGISLDRVIFAASPKWHLLRGKAIGPGNVLIFRKYSFPVTDGIIQLEDITRIKNIMSYGCQRNSRISDYVAFHLPKWIQLNSIDANKWISRMDLRIAIDKGTFTAVGEYKGMELFIDLNDDFRNNLLRLLVSEEIMIEFVYDLGNSCDTTKKVCTKINIYSIGQKR
jgi:hypothetical protein